MSDTTLPNRHAPFVGGDPWDALTTDIRTVIEDAITNHPRTLQKQIGPSEVGTPCDHCLAAKLAGWEETRDGTA